MELEKTSVPEKFLVNETKRFLPEQREVLEKGGYTVYELTGKSISDLREAGDDFWTTWPQKYPEFELQRSMRSEVAVNPNQLFLLGSNNKTFAEQESMVAKFSRDISVKIPGVKAIIGEAPDYVELVFLSLPEHHLFGPDDDGDCRYTKTQTRVGSDLAYVGGFYFSNGLSIGCSSSGHCRDNLFIVPLIVPEGNK